MNYYRRYPGDYGRDTSHLSLAEHGAYTLLMDHYYSTEKPIKTQPDMLYRLCRAFSDEERAAVLRVADEFFPIGEDGLRHNARADRQIPKERKAIDSARENGKLGGRPVAPVVTESVVGAQPDQNPPVMIIGTGSEPGSKTHPHPLPIKEEARSKAIAQPVARRFDEFWLAYPNRKGKAGALAKWKANGYDEIADKILEDVRRRQVLDRDWLRGFIPHGKTYVNSKGWEDDIPTIRQENGNGTHQPAESASGRAERKGNEHLARLEEAERRGNDPLLAAHGCDLRP